MPKEEYRKLIAARLEEFKKSLTQDVKADDADLPDVEAAEAEQIFILKEEKSFLNDKKEDFFREEDLREKRLHNDNLKQDLALRKSYAIRVFVLTCAWSAAIFTVLILNGLEYITLSENVLITLITSTTVNFFSFFLLVMKYLFQNKFYTTTPIKESTKK